MTLDEFAKITQRIISKEGFDGYLPTACFPERRQLSVLEGMPTDIQPEPPVLRWVESLAQGPEEYLVAFKIDPRTFKIVRRVGSQIESATFEVGAA